MSLTDHIPLRNPPTRRLRELTKLRSIMDHAKRLVSTCAEGDLERAFGAVTDLAAVSADSADTQVINACLCAQTVLNEFSGASKRTLRVHPGLSRFEDAVGPLPVGSMTVIGAQNNVGKSSLALEMVAGTATRDVVSGYASFEDPPTLIGARLLSMFSGVSAKLIERQQLDRDRDWPRLSKAFTQLERAGDKFLISSQVGGTHLDACAVMTRMAQRGAKMVIVDYLQAIEYAGGSDDRRNEMRKVASALKKHAARVGVALVLLSQLSRPPKGQENREPTKHDLKESGDIEDAAENVIVMWRHEESDVAPVRMKLAKGKSGGIGAMWTMQRDQRTGRFAEIE
jgi:replicative DNA helicase